MSSVVRLSRHGHASAGGKPEAGIIHKAKDLGFQIAIDDFGMGDSNFERLWRINPLIVKLDRSLLVNAENNYRARLLLESLVRMVRESGNLVLLEGIENGAQQGNLAHGPAPGRSEVVRLFVRCGCQA